MVLWTLVRFLHVLGIAFFVGGQLVLAAAVVPAVRRHGDAEAMKAAARRFGAGSLVALGVLIATGAAMAGHYRRWATGRSTSSSPCSRSFSSSRACTR